MRTVVIRMAQNEEGPEIGKLVDPDGEYFPGIDWSEVFPYWVAAEFEDDPGRIIGCAQVIPSKPIGHIEYLSFDQELTPMQKSHVIKRLQTDSELIMYGAGVFVARSAIPFELKSWKNVVKKRWGTHLYPANMYAMRVQ